MTLNQRLRELIDACFTGIWLQSHEHEDALAEIAQLCRDQQWRLAQWDISSGLQVIGAEQATGASTGQDPLAALRALSALAAPETTAVLNLPLQESSP